MQLGHNYLHAAQWQDKPEWLPDESRMLVQGIRLMKAGKPFRWWPKGQNKPILVNPVSLKTFNKYYEFFENTRLFGLPGGNGWQNELPYAMKVLRRLTYAREIIKNWQTKEASK